jgi:gliding motility-associated-like protein
MLRNIYNISIILLLHISTNLLAQNKSTNLFLSLDINTDTICPGEKVLVTANIQNGNAPYMFKDKNGNIVSPPLYVSTDSTIVYYLHLTDANGDTTSAKIKINTYQPPSINIKSSITEGCQPLTVSFNEETQSNLTRDYIWNFGNNDFSKERNPIYTYKNAGTFKVNLEVREYHNNHICTAKDTMPASITVFEKPTAKFQAQPEIVEIITPEIFFKNTSLKSNHAIWLFGDGDTSDMYEPIHIFDAIGTYNVRLIAKTENGCTDSTAKLIRVQDITSFYMPEAFTPDDDNITDNYCPKFYGIKDKDYKLEIYDRYGHIIFQTTNPLECWKGDVYGKNTAPPGTYIYIVKYKSNANVEYTKSGKILLFR